MKNKTKILMISPDIESQGGIASVVKMYSDFGLYDGNIINLASYKYNNILIRILFYFLFIIRYVYVLITDKNVKSVHIHTASKGSFYRKSIALQIAKLFNKKVILHIHGGGFEAFYQKSSQFIKNIITNTLNKSDMIIVLSRQWQEKISSICSNNNIKVLYNPAIIKELQVSREKFVKVLFLGRMCSAKGIYDIIDAVKYIQSDNILINLYGDGNLAEFQQIVAENNLQSKIKIMGWVSGEEKEEIIKNSDIYVLPSYNEGLPMSILEAMAYGLPIISTPVGGIPESVEDGFNGFLIQPGDTKALAEKIEILANDASLRKQMGQESYRIAKEKFDIKIIIKQLEEIYNGMLEKAD